MKHRPVYVFSTHIGGAHLTAAGRRAIAEYGYHPERGAGPSGGAYGIPTKDMNGKPLPVEMIAGYVARFVAYAAADLKRAYYVSALDAEPGGYGPRTLAPLFADAPHNVTLPECWQRFTGRAA